MLQAAVSVGFVALGLLTLVRWLRARDARRGWVAAGVVSLMVVNLSGYVTPSVPKPLMGFVSAIVVAVFLFSAYALLSFRDAFLKLPDRVLAAVAGGLSVLAAAFALVLLVPGWGMLGGPLTVILVLTWSAAVVEPIIRFWIASLGETTVQAYRLRFLSAGYASILVILLVAVIGGTAAAHNPRIQVGINLLALVCVPMLYLSFYPPRWLRAAWRGREEEAFAAAAMDLITFSETRAQLAQRALIWAMRLVGADGGAVVDADGTLLSAYRLDAEQVAKLAGAHHRPRDGTNVSLPLHLRQGDGRLLIVAGAFTPFFGTDEVNRLVQYSVMLAVGLDRAGFTEEMASLERAKSDFLSLAGHELRGPLTVIRGYLSFIEAGDLTGLGLEKAVRVMTDKTDEMNSLVEQMVETARIDAGRLELQISGADLGELARRSIESVKPMAGPGHELVFQVEEAVPVEVDTRRVQTILNNLVGNAIKYSPEGGDVHVVVRREGDRGVVVVRDSGVGIAPQDLPRLFTRFGRISSPETRGISGTGLGLYLSREIARKQGGDIEVDSAPGKGSTFTLKLPLAALAA